MGEGLSGERMCGGRGQVKKRRVGEKKFCNVGGTWACNTDKHRWHWALGSRKIVAEVGPGRYAKKRRPEVVSGHNYTSCVLRREGKRLT